jgi:hypothetical protein
MPSPRIIATLAVPLAGAAVLAGLSRLWEAPASQAATGRLAAAVAHSPLASPSPAGSDETADAGATGLQAQTGSVGGAYADASDAALIDPVVAAGAVLRRFCDLVDRGRWPRARHFLAGPWVWPSADLRTVARLVFQSAEVHRRHLADDLVFFTRCRVRRRSTGTLHRVVTTLVFTLGRGGADGGWLITAVSPCP